MWMQPQKSSTALNLGGMVRSNLINSSKLNVATFSHSPLRLTKESPQYLWDTTEDNKGLLPDPKNRLIYETSHLDNTSVFDGFNHKIHPFLKSSERVKLNDNVSKHKNKNQVFEGNKKTGEPDRDFNKNPIQIDSRESFKFGKEVKFHKPSKESSIANYINNVVRMLEEEKVTENCKEMPKSGKDDLNVEKFKTNGQNLSGLLSFDIGSEPTKSLIMAAGSSKTTCQLVQDLKEWKFSKSKLLELPIDEEKNNYLRRNNRGCLFSQVMPTQLKAPALVTYSKDVLINILNMDPNITKSQEFADFIAGNNILKNSIPLAHRYGGHQFGYWAMQLGDGRAILLGEFVNSAGERWELQLKGSGRTPYSRDGDGRAVLRSSIREFLCSEAMHYLGIPTSRAAAIVVSEERAFRDPMYDGNPVMEKTAVVLRLAPTWFRFGSFELPMKTNELDLLEKLFDFILKEHFPDIDPSSEDKVLSFLSRVARLTTDLVVAWQGVGFTHGVLNTDNMSVLGITIDYGPFGFVEAYDPEYVPNASDHEARYCYIRQPSIIMYNLMKLTEALFPLMSDTQKKQTSELLQAEAYYLEDSLVHEFSRKLGLTKSEKALVEMLTEMLEETKADFTMTFRDMSEIEIGQIENPCPGKYWALATLAQHKMYPQFISLYKKKLEERGISDEERRKKMCQKNPRYVLRNWMAQVAIKEAEDDNFVEVERLLRVLSSPFKRQEEAEKMGFANPPPGWASKLTLSCSS